MQQRLVREKTKINFAGVQFTGNRINDYIKIPIPALKKILSQGNVKVIKTYEYDYMIDAGRNVKKEVKPATILERILAYEKAGGRVKPQCLLLNIPKNVVYFTWIPNEDYEIMPL